MTHSFFRLLSCAVYRSKKSAPYYWFDFQFNGRRFHGFDEVHISKGGRKIRIEREKARTLVKAMNHRDIKSTLRYAHVLEGCSTLRPSCLPQS
jgi:hypothetical protein